MTNILTSDHRLVGMWRAPNANGDQGNLFSVDDVAEYLAQQTFLGRGVFNVMDPSYGAKGDGTTDDTAAILACATAAGVGGRVYFPPGRFVISGNQITGLPAQQTWEGAGYQLGVGGTTSVTEIRMSGLTGSQVGIVAGTNHVFRRILFRGPGKTGNTITGVSTTNHVQFDWCQFYALYRAVSMSGAFYPRFVNCEWNAVGTGVYFSDACYNVRFVNPIFRLLDSGTNTEGIAIQAANSARPIQVVGGSIESFSSSGGIILANGGVLSVLGTYWESSRTGSAAIGIVVSGNDCVVNVRDNLVYLTELNRWVNMSGMDTCALNGSGNTFVCANTSTSNPQAYVLPSNSTDGDVDLAGDHWDDVALAGATYVGSAFNLGAVKNKRVVAPSGYSNFIGQYQFMGRPFGVPALTAAPTTPTTGVIAMADGATWNPNGFGATQAQAVAWDGSRWVPLGRPTFVGSTTWDPPSVAAGGQTTTTVTVTGAALGDAVTASFTNDLQGMRLTGYVSASNTATVVLSNGTAGAIDLASGTLRAVAIRY